MFLGNAIRLDGGGATWEPYPLDASIILAGTPAAEVAWLHVSSAGEPGYYAGLWRVQLCAFRWSFTMHETAHIIAGRVRVTYEDESVREFTTGDIVYFPKGSTCVWEILEPLVKVFIDTE